jgi:hypothetical protein
MRSGRNSILLLSACALVVVLISQAAFSELLKTPEFVPREKGAVVVSEANGSPRWSANWTMDPSTFNGRPAVRFTETGRGRYTPFKQEVQWSLNAVWSADGTYRPMHFEKTFRDSKGVVIETDTKDFDPATHGLKIVHEKPNASPEVRRISVPDDTITVEGIGGVLRALPFDQKHSFQLHLFGNDDRLWAVNIEFRGREKVHTPLGDFDCYKVEMVPHLGFLDVVRKFLPKTHLWFTVAPPHFWVKYEGLENGMNTPTIVMELSKYEPANLTQ